MTERERKKRFKLALKWAREARTWHRSDGSDTSLGGLCIAAMAVWARAYDDKSGDEMIEFLTEVCREIGENVE